MGKRFAVLFGQKGVKDFKNLDNAKKFAKKKATETGKNVTIDKVTTNPNARQGETDFSQTQIQSIKPNNNSMGLLGGSIFGNNTTTTRQPKKKRDIFDDLRF